MGKKQQPFNNPFDGLKLKAAAPAPSKPATPHKSKAPADSMDAERRAFLEAVGAVEPLRHAKARVAPPPPSGERLPTGHEEDDEAMTALAELVASEGPFDLVSSDEFIEGNVAGLDSRVMKRLRRGDFALQGHIDLHGFVRDEAKTALEQFLVRSREQKKRCVLVVHGRGLHSQDQVPVLKAGVQAWLTRGRMSKWVLGFTSARPHDGGVGAVYVLLRR